MPRIGKCCSCGKDWVTLGSYANYRNNCDAVGFCRKCFTEHRLEFCHNKSQNYKIMKEWKLLE